MPRTRFVLAILCLAVSFSTFLRADLVRRGVVELSPQGDVTFKLSEPTFSVQTSIETGSAGPNITAPFNLVINQLVGPTTIGGDVFDCQAPTVSEAMAFSSAESTWESRIVSLKDTLSSGNLTINSCIAPIDGPFGTLGFAGPDFVKWNSATGSYVYASSGVMVFDSVDTPNLTQTAINDIILHEMGHVIGLGTLWKTDAFFPPSQNVYTDGTGQYTGAAGLAAWQSEYNRPADTFVPVELGGGPGTANGHWNEVDNGGVNTGFVSNLSGQDHRFELMTGWYDTAQPTFISNLTVQQFGDIGYNVVAVPEPSAASFLALLSFPVLCVSVLRRIVQATCAWLYPSVA